MGVCQGVAMDSLNTYSIARAYHAKPFDVLWAATLKRVSACRAGGLRLSSYSVGHPTPYAYGPSARM
jgi:hypothetical protein